jgi:hypothetical protein
MKQSEAKRRANQDFVLPFLIEYSQLKLEECSMLESHTWREVITWLRYTDERYKARAKQATKNINEYWEGKRNENQSTL